MNIDLYLKRIGLGQRPQADLAGLRAVQRAHMTAIPYENLDVQLGRPVGISPALAYDKIVGRRRGGWCYEMNGLLGYALDELGFKTCRMAGAVMREVRGDLSLSNHLVIRVDLDEGIYLADAGFGEGSFDPVCLIPGDFYSNGFKFSLSQEEGDWWRLHKFLPASRRSFDFKNEPADETAFVSRCEELQTAPDSMFVQNLLCYRHFEGGYFNLLGRVLRKVESTENIERTEVNERLVEDQNDFVTTLRDIFGLDVPEAEELWPKIMARHEQVMQEKV